MKVKWFYSIIYNLLLKKYKFRNKGLFGKIWIFFWENSSKFFSGPVYTTIHSFKAVVNNGNSYALYARLFPNYNNPLLQLVHSVHELKGSSLSFIDVGSAVGDTNLFLVKNLGNKIANFYCIEGDREYYQYLKENSRNFPNSLLFNVLLGDGENNKIKSLVKTHLGTASAVGDEILNSVSLDSLLFDKLKKEVDVIKIDVDGFDGKVLKGSQKIIERYRPYIIFEWHPIMIQRTGNEFNEHFEVLLELGYDRFLWFNKYGCFSHFDLKFDFESRQELIKLCLGNIHEYDWHYDVIALHSESKIDILKIAEMKFAKSKISYY